MDSSYNSSGAYPTQQPPPVGAQDTAASGEASGCCGRISGWLPGRAKDRPKAFCMRLAQALIAVIAFGSISDKVQPDSDHCYYGLELESTGYNDGEAGACGFGIATGVLAMLFAVFIAIFQCLNFNYPAWCYFAECCSSALMAFFWFISAAYLTDTLRITCENITCADPCATTCDAIINTGDYDEASYDNAMSAIIFSWLSLFLWMMSAHWAFNCYIHGGPTEDATEETQSTLQRLFTAMREKSLLLVPNKLRSYPGPWIVRWIEFFCAIIVFGGVADECLQEIGGKTYCFFGLDEDFDDKTDTCDYAIAIGVMSMIFTGVAIAVMFFIEGNSLSRMIDLGATAVFTFLWFVCACLLSAEIKQTCKVTTCADMGMEFDEKTYSNAQSAVFFSWVSFILWFKSTMYCYIVWNNGGLPDGTTDKNTAEAYPPSAGPYVPPPVMTPGAPAPAAYPPTSGVPSAYPPPAYPQQPASAPGYPTGGAPGYPNM